jgi:hypothetical protein
MLRRILILPMLLLLAGLTACSARVGYRVYDPGYRDYHVWNDGEIGYYHTWIGETHRPYRDYRRLNRHDQDEYWHWRHDHDRDHDRDRR